MRGFLRCFALILALLAGNFFCPDNLWAANALDAARQRVQASSVAGESCSDEADVCRPGPMDAKKAVSQAQGAAPADASPDSSLPAVTDGRLLAKLENGLTVLVVEDKRFPLVAERFYVRAGSAYEAKGQEGISHLLEHMVFNSTVKRSKGAVAGDIEHAGGDINAATSFDYTRYMADLPSAQWKLGLDVFQDMIFGAKFDPDELEQEKKVVIAELTEGLDDPGRCLFTASERMAWRSLPYEHPVIGYRDQIQAVTPSDLRAYVKRLYQPQSMLLTVVGDVDAREVYQEAQRVFGGLADDRSVTPPDIPDTRNLPAFTSGPQAVAQTGNWQKCSLRVNFAVPGLYSAKDVPLDVLADVLGGGSTSLLYRKFVYEQELADEIAVSHTSMERGGMLSITATVSPDKLDLFWQALTKELAGLTADAFSKEDLARTKISGEDALYSARETLGGLATKLAYYQFFGFGPLGERNELYTLRHTGRQDLQELLAAYVHPENLSLAVLVPGQDQAKADALAARMLQELKTNWPAPDRQTPSQASETGGKVQEPEVVNLDNGHRVVLLPDTTMPYVSLRMVWRGGDSLLAQNDQGLGVLTAQALTRSTPTRSAIALRDFLADRAASVSAIAGRDTFVLGARYPSRFAPDIQGLLQEIITTPAFDPAEINRIKHTQAADILEEQDDPEGLAGRNLFPFLFPKGHYGYFHSGQPDTLANFTPADIKRFWDKQRKTPWVLAVCGTFDRKAILDMARTLAATPAGQAPDFTTPAFTGKHELTLTLKGREQTHLYWILPVPGAQSPDTPALEALNAALSGQGGILFQNLRDEQGLGYSVTSSLWQSPKAGFLLFSIATDPSKAAQALDGFKQVAADTAERGISSAQLERVKNALTGGYYQGRQSLGSRAEQSALSLAMGYPMDFDKQTLDRVRALNTAQVAEAAKKYLDASKAYLLRVVP